MMSLQHVVDLTDAQAVSSPSLMPEADTQIAGVSIDTRTIRDGELFIALRGERQGECYLPDAHAKHAAAALVADECYRDYLVEALPTFRVPDGIQALQQIAADWRARFDIALCAVTGSNGKTTVKEMLRAIAEAHLGADRVMSSYGNFNNGIGLPLSLLSLRAQHRIGIVEIGMNHFGEIDALGRIANPGVGIINNASEAHLAGVGGNIDGVIRAKGELIGTIADGGTLIVNHDSVGAERWIQQANQRGLSVRRFAFGTKSSTANNPANDVALDICIRKNEDAESSWHFHTDEGVETIQLHVPGEHNAANAAAAALAARCFGISWCDIQRGLAEFHGVKGRLTILPLREGRMLIDDSYNANPGSVKEALSLLAARGGAGRKIAVLADMLELRRGIFPRAYRDRTIRCHVAD